MKMRGLSFFREKKEMEVADQNIVD
uniref:Uncharacterized protein n=1 Tax=Nelumbo nucifera TaxID=4432 RepID=A0A822YAS8_NELNU|nr:TPA_asm: hypothetical protein HUJ06_030691 [Nelumbo nucifera]